MNMLCAQKIDILKLDIEGSEYAALENFLIPGIEINQFLVEFNHSFAKVGLAAMGRAIMLLNASGFKTLSVGSDGQERSFIRAKQSVSTLFRAVLGVLGVLGVA